jgi:protein SCO1/2
MTRTQKIALIVIALATLALGFAVSQALLGGDQQAKRAQLDAGIVLLPQSRRLPALTLTDQDNQPVALDSLKERWSLLFFGYTFCPDICPATLAQLRQLKKDVPADTFAKLRVVLVSVDPKRDTPEQLKKYLGYFDPGFQGLTGDEDSIQKLATAVSIPFIPADTSQANYTVSHSANLVIIGPDGRQRGFIRAPLDNSKLAEQLPRLLDSES